MSNFSKMAAFYGQAQSGRNFVKPPSVNASVTGYNTGTSTQKAKTNEAVDEKNTLQQRDLSQEATSAVAPSFSTAQTVKAQNGTAPVSFSSSDEDLTNSVNKSYEQARTTNANNAAAFSQSANQNLSNFYNTAGTELDSQAQSKPTEMAGPSTYQTAQKNFLQSTQQDLLSNAPLLAQMYNLSPEGLALESQVRQGEVNKLRSDAGAALADREMAEGSADTVSQQFGLTVDQKRKELDAANQAQTTAIEAKEAEIRNNPLLSPEAQAQELQQLQQKRDVMRVDTANQMAKQSLEQLQRLSEPSTRDFNTSSLDRFLPDQKLKAPKDSSKQAIKNYQNMEKVASGLRAQGFSDVEITNALKSQGVEPGVISVALDPTTTAFKIQQVKDAKATKDASDMTFRKNKVKELDSKIASLRSKLRSAQGPGNEKAKERKALTKQIDDTMTQRGKLAGEIKKIEGQPTRRKKPKKNEVYKVGDALAKAFSF